MSYVTECPFCEVDVPATPSPTRGFFKVDKHNEGLDEDEPRCAGTWEDVRSVDVFEVDEPDCSQRVTTNDGCRACGADPGMLCLDGPEVA